MKRHQWILLALLIAQIVVCVIVLWPRKAATVSTKPVFADLKVEDIVALTITDDNNNNLDLRKVDGQWVLPNADNYPVNEATITPILEKIVKLDQSNLVTRTEASHKQLKVAKEDYLRRVIIEKQDGTLYVIYLGTAPRYTAAHFRIEGQNETYLTSDLATWELNPTGTSWFDTSLVSIDQTTITQVVLENANGTFSFIRDGESWKLADQTADEVISTGNVGTVVRNASSVNMARPLGTAADPAYGLDIPNAKVTVTTNDGATHVLLVGSKDATDSTYVVKSSDSPYYVRVAEYNVNALLNNTRQDFIQEPTPIPTPTATP